MQQLHTVRILDETRVYVYRTLTLENILANYKSVEIHDLCRVCVSVILQLIDRKQDKTM